MHLQEHTFSQLGQEAEVYLLNGDQFDHYWPEISKLLDQDEDLWNKWFTKEGIRQRVLEQHMQVWVVLETGGPVRCFFITQVLITEVQKILHIFWIWGNLPDGALKCMALTLDRFGAHTGCSSLSMFGRKGWERRLRAFGAHFDGITLSRPIQSVARN